MRRSYNLAECWHLMSLDAPTIAVLWSCFFARAVHIPPPYRAALLLTSAIWLVYAGDRILDGLTAGRAEKLRERHRFHARHRKGFLLAAALLSGALAAAGPVDILPGMPSAALHEDAVLGALAFLYFAAVHLPRLRRSPWLPKEFAVGVLFAAASAVPAWSHLTFGRMYEHRDLGKAQLAPAICLFALLCWINCTGIEKWEALTGPKAGGMHASTRWAAAHLQTILPAVAAGAAVQAWLSPWYGLKAVYLAVLLSSVLLLLLDLRSSRLSSLHLRIAADAALLTPLAFLPIRR
jgi:hypothetical protein